MAKPKTTSIDLSGTGAAQALARLEKEELQTYAAKEALEARLGELVQPSPNATSEQREVWIAEKLQIESDLLFSLRRWDISRKALLEFDRGVAPEKREGEKILVSEAKEIFAQYQLSIDLAIEQTIIADAQSAALCDSPEAFHIAHAGNYHAAKEGAITAAKNDGALPSWIL